MTEPRRPGAPSGRSPARGPARGPARTPGGKPGRTTGRTPGRAPARPTDRTPGRTSGSATRPGAREASSRPRSGAGQAAPRTPRPAAEASAAVAPPARRRFTGRSAILAVVVAVLVISYASSLRAYLQQRAHINDLRAQITSSSADISRLQTEQKRWSDDHYVMDQARARFGWVLPGETAYQVIGRDGKALSTTDRLTDRDDVVSSKPAAWWTTQYDSLKAADHPTKKQQRQPAASIPADAK